MNNKRPAKRLVVLISGSGSNLQAVLDACSAGSLNAQVAAVIANRPDAYGLTRAQAAGIPAVVKVKPKNQDRQVYDAELADLAASFQPDFIVLAGWMRILSPVFLDRFPGRVINLHPALPGMFPGTHAIQRAYDAFQAGSITHSGVMVHLVPDAGVDCGPVLAQETIAMHPGESLEAFEARVHQVEHRLLVRTLQMCCDERDE